MNMLKLRWRVCVLALCLTTCQAGRAVAQIIVGQTAGFTGAVAASVKEATDGAKLYIDSINAKGGEIGRAHV